MSKSTSPSATRIQVFKSGYRWAAHLYWNDGTCWSYWQDNWKTKRELLLNINAVLATAGTYPSIERGVDE